MLTIYHAQGTRSIRPIWLCYELGLALDIQTVDFSPEFLTSTEWRSISPAGKLPILRDDELTMFESGAMMDYILEKYGGGRLKPAVGTHDSALHQQWSWFSESTLARPLGINRMLRSMPTDSPSLAEDARTKIYTCLQVVESTLEGRQYLLGDTFYSADIMMGYSLALTQRFKMLTNELPNTLRYLDSLKGRPACQRAFEA